MAERKSADADGTVKLRGFKEPLPSPPALESKFVHVKAEFRGDRTRAGLQTDTETLTDRDVVEVELADGQYLWMNGEDYRKRFAGAPSRDATGEPVVVVPDNLDVLPCGMQARGSLWLSTGTRHVG